jgi:hypothetical protein
MAGATLIVDRGLPDANLNNAAGVDRSNVAWDFNPPEDFVAGDDFTLQGLPPKTGWRIDQIWIWSIAGVPDGTFELGDRFQTISLFLGPDGDPGAVIPIVMSANLTGNASDNPDVVVTPVQYPSDPAVDYQGSGGAFIQIWQIDFFNVGVFGAGTYLFGADGIGQAGLNWFNHASNAALSGTPQDGSDDLYHWFSGNAGDGFLTLGGTVDSDGFGWDKSSDINIQVWATEVHVPEPGGLALVSIGILGLAVAVRRRRSQAPPLKAVAVGL